MVGCVQVVVNSSECTVDAGQCMAKICAGSGE